MSGDIYHSRYPNYRENTVVYDSLAAASSGRHSKCQTGTLASTSESVSQICFDNSSSFASTDGQDGNMAPMASSIHSRYIWLCGACER